jgi:transcriptional regulator GlxA family with amidase domain
MITQTNQAVVKTLGIVLFPNFETLDVFGPLEMFGMLSDKIKIIMISEHQGLVKSHQGQSVLTEFNWHNAPHLDLLLIPGGEGTRHEIYNQPLLDWLKFRSDQADITLSVCTGAALMAKAGVLDGHRATTNKLAFQWVVEQGPEVTWINKARWVDDGNVITSSGVSAGIDMSLYTIARLFGEAARNEVAQKVEYVMNTDPSVDLFYGMPCTNDLI